MISSCTRFSSADCGAAMQIHNGQVDNSNGTTYLSKVVYTCNVGYDLTGSNSSSCKENGNWTQVKAQCIIKGRICVNACVV